MQDKSIWGCNALQNPTTEDTLYDGTYVSALEGMFVKVKEEFIIRGDEFATSTVAYQRWMDAAGANVSSTAYQHASSSTLAAIEEARRHEACFDAGYYAQQNGLQTGGAALDGRLLFQHFVYLGQFFGYAWRPTCRPPGDSIDLLLNEHDAMGSQPEQGV
jgi:hypothetical protein